MTRRDSCIGVPMTCERAFDIVVEGAARTIRLYGV
jgi:hypothetical protein